MRARLLLLALASLSLSACESWVFDQGERPDYRIRVAPAPDGKGYVAIPPECASWTDNQPPMAQNHPWPQFGCSTARNLAVMVEDPADLLEGRDEGAASGIMAGAATRRYYGGATKSLIDPYKKETSVGATMTEQSPEGYK